MNAKATGEPGAAKRKHAERCATLERAHEVLTRIEWTPNQDEYGNHIRQCPCCWREQHEGHAADCELHAVLIEV